MKSLLLTLLFAPVAAFTQVDEFNYTSQAGFETFYLNPASDSREPFELNVAEGYLETVQSGGNPQFSAASLQPVGPLSSVSGPLTFSIDFLTAGTVGFSGLGNVAKIGFADSAGPGTFGETGWEVSLRYSAGDFGASTPVGLRLRPNGNSSGQLFSNGVSEDTFDPNLWYTLEMTILYDSEDLFNITSRVYPQGSPGNTLISFSGQQTNADLSPDEVLYPAFGARTGATGGIAAVDNLVPVPEPGAFGLLLGAGVCVAALRHRR
ncbi:MAG: PEP-CTERM sorting domain-containing protein [Opitutales bacterium]